MENTVEQVEISLPYYKQGDDLHGHLKDSKDPVEAFRSHARQMRAAAKHLDNVALLFEQNRGILDQVQIDADTHMIMVSGPERFLESLIDKDLARQADIE